MAIDQILGFSIGFRRRLYNTLALSCECDIITVLIYRRPLKVPNKHHLRQRRNTRPGATDINVSRHRSAHSVYK